MRLDFALFLPGEKTEKGIEYVRELGLRRGQKGMSKAGMRIEEREENDLVQD